MKCKLRINLVMIQLSLICNDISILTEALLLTNRKYNSALVFKSVTSANKTSRSLGLSLKKRSLYNFNSQFDTLFKNNKLVMCFGDECNKNNDIIPCVKNLRSFGLLVYSLIYTK